MSRFRDFGVFFKLETVRMYVTTSRTAAIVFGLWAIIVSPIGAQAADQSTGEALAQSKACMACHQVDSKRVGPPLRSIGERYAAAGEGDAMVQYLAGKIRSGGRGVWGAVPMPAQPQVSEEDARTLAEWVLSLAPAKSK